MKKKLTYYILALLSFLSVDSLTLISAQVDSLRDFSAEKDLTIRLMPIKENFKRINSIANWTSIDAKGLWESIEGGEIKYYYQNDILEKIVTRHYGEMFQRLTEYYSLNGQLSFVYVKHYRYYKTFDFENSEIFEHRSYFENGVMIHHISDQSEASPFSDYYFLEEISRLRASYEKYVAGKDLEEL